MVYMFSSQKFGLARANPYINFNFSETTVKYQVSDHIKRKFFTTLFATTFLFVQSISPVKLRS